MEHEFKIKLADVVANADGSIFTKEQMQKLIESFAKETISKNGAYGELGHQTSSGLHYENLVCKITDISFDDNFEGTVSTVIPISNGYKETGIISNRADLVAEFIKKGCPLNMQPRFYNGKIIALDVEPIIYENN